MEQVKAKMQRSERNFIQISDVKFTNAQEQLSRKSEKRRDLKVDTSWSVFAGQPRIRNGIDRNNRSIRSVIAGFASARLENHGAAPKFHGLPIGKTNQTANHELTGLFFVAHKRKAALTLPRRALDDAA